MSAMSFNIGAFSDESKLYAIADLHLSYKQNRDALVSTLSADYPHGSGLILAGDIGESAEHLRLAFGKARECFEYVWWVPGNHELYTLPSGGSIGTSTAQEGNARVTQSHENGEEAARKREDEAVRSKKGEDKYFACVRIAHEYGVFTPEDDFIVWFGAGGPAIVAPCFALYDYSFRPEEVETVEDALKWARKDGVEATDEALLHFEPYRSRVAWCESLVQRFEEKLDFVCSQNPGIPTVLINHWPLREDLVFIPLIPKFSIWCGTKKTEDWHIKYRAKVVVTGHLHVRRTDWRVGHDGQWMRFEECSLGYPRQWREAREEMGKGVSDMMREILPGPGGPLAGEERKTAWRRWG